MYYGWYIVSVCVIISMYYSGTIYMGFTTIFEPIALETGWSYTQVSFAASLRGFETGILVIISGMIMDRYGPRILIFCGSIITGLGLILLSRINSLIMFYISFSIICIGISSVPTGLLMATVSRWFRKRQGLAMGITASGVSLGGLLIPVVTAIVDSFGWRQGIFMLGLGVWIIPLPLSLLLRHQPEKFGLERDTDGGNIQVQEGHSGQGKSGKESIGLKEVLSSKILWIISSAFLFHVMCISAVMTHIMPFFSNIGVKRGISSLIISSVPITGIIGRVGFGILGDRIERLKVATFALALTGVGVLIFMCISNERLWLVSVFIIVFGIGWGGLVPMLPGLVIKYFGENRVGSIIGCINSIMMVGLIIGAPMAGWIFDLKGSYEKAWLIMGSTLLLMTIIFFSLLSQKNYE